MEFRAPSLLGKRPRGYVPDDVAARQRGGGGDGDGSDSEGGEGGAAEPRSGTERVVDAALRAEAAAKAATKGAQGTAKKSAKSVTFAEPAAEEEEPGLAAPPACANSAPDARCVRRARRRRRRRRAQRHGAAPKARHAPKPSGTNSCASPRAHR
jgi:hypothetical protein